MDEFWLAWMPPDSPDSLQESFGTMARRDDRAYDLVLNQGVTRLQFWQPQFPEWHDENIEALKARVIQRQLDEARKSGGLVGD